MNFEQRPTNSLRPYSGNARTHSPKQVKQIARSIERFGFNNPVLIDDDDQIIAGHGRVEAAKQLRMKTVPCVRLVNRRSNLTPRIAASVNVTLMQPLQRPMRCRLIDRAR
jgi:hypothetical protein